MISRVFSQFCPGHALPSQQAAPKPRSAPKPGGGAKAELFQNFLEAGCVQRDGNSKFWIQMRINPSCCFFHHKLIINWPTRSHQRSSPCLATWNGPREPRPDVWPRRSMPICASRWDFFFITWCTGNNIK